MLRLSRTPLDARSKKDGDEAGSDGDKASPASRLRAAMSRLGPSSPPEQPPAPPSESDSDLNPVFSARKSLKDVFSRAMRDNRDSPDSKSSSSNRNSNKAEEEDDSQLSDSSLPLSSQAASMQLLRQRLEIPEMSSRIDASRSTAKPSNSHQDLHHLLRTAEEKEDADVSLDTARPASPPARGVSDLQFGEEAPPPRSTRISTPTRQLSRPNRADSGTLSPPNGIPDLPGLPLSDAETDGASFALPTTRTPKPPGGWFTPSRAAGSTTMLDSASATPGYAQTPAPPGAWKGTPIPPQSRKGILKVRFDNTLSSTSQKADLLSQNANQAGSSRLPDVSDSEDVESVSARAVTLVDNFGRERKFDENGDEMALPPVGEAQETQPRKKGASVRLVDSMGNELDPSLFKSQDASSDLGDYDDAALVTKIRANATTLQQGIENAELRHESLRIRRVGKQSSVPHERILQLAMDSRAARIERERLLRQSHLVRTHKEQLSAQLIKLQARPLLTTQTIDSPRTSLHLNKGLVALLLLLPLLLLSLLYICARAYVRYYFLTNYYDPFFATVDPASLQRIPFVRLLGLPRRWGSFNVQTAGQAILGRFSGGKGVNRHVLTIISKPLAELDIKLPS